MPEEYRSVARGRRDYLDLLINQMLPEVAREGLANFANVFCEPGVFTVGESRLVLDAANGPGSVSRFMLMS